MMEGRVLICLGCCYPCIPYFPRLGVRFLQLLLELDVLVLPFLRDLISIDLGFQISRTQFLGILLNIFFPELLFS